MISENLLNSIPEQYRAIIAAADNIHLALNADWSIKAMNKAYMDDNGLMRWMSNNRIVPHGETIEIWVLIGFITRDQANAMNKANKEEENAWIEENADDLVKYFKNARKLNPEFEDPDLC